MFDLLYPGWSCVRKNYACPSLTECAAGSINIARWCDGLRRPRGSFPRLGWHQRPYVTLEQQLNLQWLGHSGEKNQHDIRIAFAFLVNGIYKT